MKLNVKDFRNIKDTTFKIIDNTLVLVGKNGVGKSNVLEAIKSNNFSVSNGNRYDDIIYVAAGVSVDMSIHFEEGSIFMQLVDVLCENASEEQKKDLLYSEINAILAESELPVAFEKEQEDFLKCCNNLGSGIKRRLLYKLLYKVATSVTDKKLIILVDSPELYAQPSMVRLFCNQLKFLSEKGHLVIVSTHDAKVV